MRRINTENLRTIESELSTRYERSISPPIDCDHIRVIELECICGSLLNIESSVIQLFHPRGVGKGNSDKLSCPQCLSILETMSDDGDHYWECIRDGYWNKLTIREVAE